MYEDGYSKEQVEKDHQGEIERLCSMYPEVSREEIVLQYNSIRSEIEPSARVGRLLSTIVSKEVKNSLSKGNGKRN